MQDFKDMKVIACGQYSQVFSAKQRKENKLYSIKKYIKKTLTRQRIAPNVPQEIEIMNQAGDNSYTIRLYNHFEDREAIYLVMEYMNCGNMQQKLLKDKKLSELETLHYVKQMIDILEYLHSLHIAHRNFCLENILLRKNEKKQMVIKLCDFGFSTSAIHENGVFNRSDVFGPEQFNLQPQTEALDIWSLGVVIYQMIVGKLPFEPRQEQLKGKKKLDVLQQNIVNGHFVPNILSEGAKDLLTWIFQINPSKRPTAQQVKEHWWIGGTSRPIEKINMISVLEEEEIQPEENKQPSKELVIEQVDFSDQITQARCSVKQKIQKQIKLPELQDQKLLQKVNKIDIFQLQESELKQQLALIQDNLRQITDLNIALQSELMLKSSETTHFSDQRESVVTYKNYDSSSRQGFCKVQMQQIPLFEGEKFCLEQGIQQQNEKQQTLREAEKQLQKCQEEIVNNENYTQELIKTKKLLLKQIQDLEEKRSFMKLEVGIIDIQQEIEKKLRALVVDQNDKIPNLEKFNEIFIQYQIEENKQQQQNCVARISDLSKLENEEFPEKKQAKLNNLKSLIQDARDKQQLSLVQINENSKSLNQIDEQLLKFRLNEQLGRRDKMNDDLQELQEKMDGLLREIELQEQDIRELEIERKEIEQTNMRSNIIF